MTETTDRPYKDLSKQHLGAKIDALTVTYHPLSATERQMLRDIVKELNIREGEARA